ncbi:histidine kinase dimerization/phospho-acceptor domain-containing protein, partial [Rhizobium leguminosarum]|uniref:histidine kinase dimerization/phospho-acceptor domain-containing protein n=1 Tax=Rhizobium leguminosarum TaxID=384 RepID=UPI003F9EB188
LRYIAEGEDEIALTRAVIGGKFDSGAADDISEVRRIDRMRSDLVANASHELSTPLASLRGFIETIQGPEKNDLKAQARF